MKTAVAQPNIALIKYWGKADEKLMLPAAGSLSLTLDIHPTTTRAEKDPSLASDLLTLNGQTANERAQGRAKRVLDVVRSWAGESVGCAPSELPFLKIDSTNEVPTGAGLASSASGFAALVTAAAAEYGLELGTRELSRLARRGSGSATRSIIDGLAVWHAGNDEESFAEQVEGPELSMVTVIMEHAHKSITSREGMRITEKTSPYYPAWVADTENLLAEMLTACANKDIEHIGELTEISALRMHSMIMSARPPILYLTHESWKVWEYAQEARKRGIPVYATSDAGANVVLLTTPEYASVVASEAATFGTTAISGAGRGARLIDSEN